MVNLVTQILENCTRVFNSSKQIYSEPDQINVGCGGPPQGNVTHSTLKSTNVEEYLCNNLWGKMFKNRIKLATKQRLDKDIPLKKGPSKIEDLSCKNLPF